MSRRLRREREVVFGFDSFLDVVTNVVGIIIRLILVVWVSARSYSSVKMYLQDPPSEPVVTAPKELKDPLEAELEKQRQELARAREQLLERLRQLQVGQERQRQADTQLADLYARRQDLDRQQVTLEAGLARSDDPRRAELSLAELKERQQKVLEAIRELEKQPAQKKILRFRTPVSRPVSGEEFRFECRSGRVTYIDIAALAEEIRLTVEEKLETLERTWQVSDVTRPAGAFRLRYTLERQRDNLDSLLGLAMPDARSSFRVGLSWQVEPIAPTRGETIDEALAPRSEFRRLVDALDPQSSAVTFWVYSDSFPVYRQLRDYLYQRDLTVAGRPLPLDMPITFSWRGSRSLGQ